MVKTLILFLLSSCLSLSAFQLPPQSTQAIVGIASDWDSSRVTLQLYEKDAQGTWQKVSQPWKGRLGASGLAWGRGLNPAPSTGKQKKEGDRRAPAGVFSLGGAWGYAAQSSYHQNLPYQQITSRDLWVEDVSSPSYNKHIRLDHEPKSAWEKKQQMRQGDAAHALKLFVNHNAGSQIVPGAGSAIFFHIWRGGGSKATFGCTTMAKEQLQSLLKWVDPQRRPVYILLPQDEYSAKRAEWKLP